MPSFRSYCNICYYRHATILSLMKFLLKKLAFLFSSIVVSPLVTVFYLLQHLSSAQSFFQGCSQLLSIVPFRVGVYLRAAFYKHTCHNVDREISVGFMTLLSQSNTDIHKNTYIGSQCNIGSCSIGKDCLLGSGVHILSGKNQHNFSDLDTPIRNQEGIITKIEIGENCWIGNNATVMANIGPNSIIAAGSVVVDQVPEKSIVAGNPARVVKTR